MLNNIEKFKLKIAGWSVGINNYEPNPFAELCAPEVRKIYEEGIELGKNDRLKRHKEFLEEFE